MATILFPIPNAEYDHCIFILNALEIGSPFTADCKVEEFSAGSPVLQRLVGSNINIDELDYLVKRMDSFDKRELAQFSAVAVSQDIHEIKDLINLRFCCQGVPIVQDIFKRKLDGWSAQAIADQLNQADILSPMEYKRWIGSKYASTFKRNNKALWTTVAVLCILKTPLYIGTLVQGKRATTSYKVKKCFDVAEDKWAVTPIAMRQ